MNETDSIAKFIKQSRKAERITQIQLSKLAGVGIRFVRELESGKQTVQLRKVNQVLKLFGHVLAPVRIKKRLADKSNE